MTSQQAKEILALYRPDAGAADPQMAEALEQQDTNRVTVVQNGNPCDAVYFILCGELRVRLLVGVVDKADKTLCKIGGGESFGELGMFLQAKRTADVIAETESRLFRMTTSAFMLLVRQIPELGSPVLFNIGVTMARRMAAVPWARVSNAAGKSFLAIRPFSERQYCKAPSGPCSARTF